MAEVYGDNDLLKETVDLLYSSMGDLKTAMQSQLVSPLFSGVYSTHHLAKVSFPAVSVGIDEVEIGSEPEASGNQAGTGTVTESYYVKADIRVHMDYRGGFRDRVNLQYLMDSLKNWIAIHKQGYFETLNDFMGMRAENIEFDSDFDESYTIGGRLILRLNFQRNHLQE